MTSTPRAATFEYDSSESSKASKVETPSTSRASRRSFVEDISAAIKLGTIDKFKMMVSRGKENIFLSWKERSIDKLGEKERELLEEAEMLKSEKEAEGKKFEEKIKDPSFTDTMLQNILKDRKARREKDFDDKIHDTEKKKDEVLDKKQKNEQSAEKYKSTVTSIEETFNKKIDGRIEDVKARYSLEEKVKDREKLQQGIEKAEAEVRDVENRLEQFDRALENVDDKESVKALKEGAKVLKQLLEVRDENLEKLEKAKAKLDRNIDKINGKVEKWSKMKPRQESSSPSVQSSPESSSPETVIAEESTSADSDVEAELTPEGRIEKLEEVKALINESMKLDKLDKDKFIKDTIEPALASLDSLGADDQDAGELHWIYMHLIAIKSHLIESKKPIDLQKLKEYNLKRVLEHLERATEAEQQN